jgi:sodium/hydrogen exchanger 2
VLVLTKILNRGRLVKINYVDQFIMAYGGLRGAVCYGLVMSIVALPGSPKYMFVTATVFVILFTVFVQVRAVVMRRDACLAGRHDQTVGADVEGETR